MQKFRPSQIFKFVHTNRKNYQFLIKNNSFHVAICHSLDFILWWRRHVSTLLWVGKSNFLRRFWWVIYWKLPYFSSDSTQCLITFRVPFQYLKEDVEQKRYRFRLYFKSSGTFQKVFKKQTYNFTVAAQHFQTFNAYRKMIISKSDQILNRCDYLVKCYTCENIKEKSGTGTELTHYGHSGAQPSRKSVSCTVAASLRLF